MNRFLWICLGGGIGTGARYLLSGWLLAAFGTAFPYGTLAVNLIGCFAIGFLSQLAETRGFFTAETRTLIFIGVLGGFTTFSAFSNETINLWREGESFLATINVAAHLVLCLGAVWLSRAVAYQIWK